jgi:divalent metal cation (Fe/Co/Zn/Cd) transporter
MSQVTSNSLQTETRRLFTMAWWLAAFTIGYNLIEAVVALYFGEKDESLTLFGFGVDSLIEVISGIGIAHMVLRIWRSTTNDRDRFERTALWITGGGFYVLALGLVLSGGYRAVSGEKPQSTLIGIVLSLISIAVMWALMRAKLKVGNALQSSPIIADAHCTKICIYMSAVLLVASGAYEMTGFAYVDVIGSLGLAWLSCTEGREAFGKARNGGTCACGDV